MVTVERDGAYLVFKRDGVEFYDTAIPQQSDVGRLMRYMSDKMWFQDVRAKTLYLIVSALGESSHDARA